MRANNDHDNLNCIIRNYKLLSVAEIRIMQLSMQPPLRIVVFQRFYQDRHRLRAAARHRQQVCHDEELVNRNHTRMRLCNSMNLSRVNCNRLR